MPRVSLDLELEDDRAAVGAVTAEVLHPIHLREQGAALLDRERVAGAARVAEAAAGAAR